MVPTDVASWSGSSGDLYRRVFDEAPEALLILNENRFVDGNRASARLLDYRDKEEMLPQGRARRPVDLSPERQPDGRRSDEKAQEVLAMAARSGHYRFDWTHVGADGRLVPVEVQLTPLSPDGRWMACAWRDRRQREQLPEGLCRAERLAVLGQHAARLAHDLNGMLTVVNGSADLLELDCTAVPSASEHLGGIRAAVDRVTRWTEQLLRFAAGTERGGSVDVAAVVHRLEPLLTLLVGPRVTVRVDVVSCRVELPEAGLEQLVVNLVSNAAQAMADGGVVRVLVTPTGRSGDGPQLARLEVVDAGVGMDRAQVDRAFEPFYTTRPDGTGLGLATVRSIVDAAAGSVEVDSEPGRGTRVVVHLPLLREAALPVADAPRGVDPGRHGG
ncbi:MAG: two-component system sensor histidine kinase NtrB [Planctomycetota bacterium]